MLLPINWSNIAKFSITMFLTRPFEVMWMKNISDQVTFDEGLKDI